MDNELLRIYQLIHELSEQSAASHKLLKTHILPQAASIITEVTGTGATNLRRVIVDITKEYFESDAERTNAQLVIENHILSKENAHLSSHLKDYEDTMETVMSKFRNHALAAQQHESTLTRHYETLIAAREAQGTTEVRASSTINPVSLQRMSQHLRALMRSLQGEEPDPAYHAPGGAYRDPYRDTQLIERDISAYENPNAEASTSYVEFDPESGTPATSESLSSLLESLDEGEEGVRADWAFEREDQITRLDKENEEMRRLLEITPDQLNEKGVSLELLDEHRLKFLNTRKRPVYTPAAPGQNFSYNPGSAFPPSNLIPSVNYHPNANPTPGWGGGYMIGSGSNNGQQPIQQQQQQPPMPAPLQRPIQIQRTTIPTGQPVTTDGTGSGFIPARGALGVSPLSPGPSLLSQPIALAPQTTSPEKRQPWVDL